MTYKIEEAGKTFIYHWFVYMLGALKQIDLSSKIDVCFDREDYNAYQKESFELLSDILNVVPNDCQWDLVPSIKPRDIRNNSGQDHVDPSTYFFLRDLFLSRVDNKFDMTDYDKIYICRGRSHLCEGNREDSAVPGVRRRQIMNEGEVVESLEEMGVKCIFFEDYTVAEKIQIFNKASLIISPQSGGMVFSLFAGPQTDIVEIYPPNPHQYCDQYIDICRHLGIPFRRFTDVAKLDGYDNMVVDSTELVNFVQG